MKNINILLIGIVIVFASGCLPDDEDLSLNLNSNSSVEASFTIESIPGEANRFILNNSTPGAFISIWDLGDGKGFQRGSEMDSVFLPDAGDYDVRLVTVTEIGSDTSSVQTLNVATSDPNSGNLVVGGKMDSASDWNIYTIGGGGVTFSVADGKMTATGGGWAQAAFYQAIEVVADKEYAFDATVSGSGASNTWFEVYMAEKEPADGEEYTEGGIQLALNTWAGCGGTPFSGSFMSIGCAGSLKDTNGVISFENTGTIYLLVRGGGEWLGDTGISIDNIELRGTGN